MPIGPNGLRRSHEPASRPITSASAQILQRDNPGLFVSVTMPSTPTGANYFGGLLLGEAKSLGFTPDDFTIMPFDGGFSSGSSQVTALKDFNAQLMSSYGWSSAQAYAHEGFSGMDGRTDTGEYFYQGDFAAVLSFAQGSGLSRYTFWSVNRDRQCNPAARPAPGTTTAPAETGRRGQGSPGGSPGNFQMPGSCG